MSITLSNVSIGYSKNKIISNINISITSGSYITIIGENGTGKSTLIKTILGLIPSVEGNIIFGEGLKRNEIGFLPQVTISKQDFPASSFEIVLSGLLNKIGIRPFYGKKEKELVINAMRKLDILSLKNKSYSKLSGGEKQRVLLARALCASSKVLILDEPATSLDKVSRVNFFKLIKELNINDNLTIIMVTHNLEEVLDDTNEIIRVNKDGASLFSKEDYVKEYNI